MSADAVDRRAATSPANGRRGGRPARGERPLTATYTVKLPQDLHEWVLLQGGAEYVRRLLEEDRIKRLVA